MPIHFTGHVVLYRYQHTQTDRKGKFMRIILDDRRPMPEKGPYNCVRTYEDCTYLLRNIHVISFISLDYDLSGRETGYDVLKYMVEHGNHVKHINIHSDHSIGVPKMEAYVRKHFPNAELTFNPL